MQSITTTRRGFVAALSVPMILGATNKSGSQLPILGSGEFKYEAHHDWGELPASIKYGNTHGVCEDSQGHIYIHHTVNAASESHDTMVGLDPRASSSAPGARSSRAAPTAFTSIKKASRSSSTSATPRRPSSQAHTERGRGLDDRLSQGMLTPTQAGRGRQADQI